MTDITESLKSKGGANTILGGRKAISPVADAIGGIGMGGEKKKKKPGAVSSTLGGAAEQLGGV